MATHWRKVMQFPKNAKPSFDEVHTRYLKLIRATTGAEERRNLMDAYEAARVELGARPTGTEN